MDAAMRPVPASVKPTVASTKTVMTNADEMGLESEMPQEMPLMSTNRNTRPMAISTNINGVCISCVATTMTASAQKTTHAMRRRMSRLAQTSVACGARLWRSRKRAIAWRKISVRSTIAAPMIMPSAMMKPILRNGLPGSSQPISFNQGVSHRPTAPMTAPETAMRQPTIMPAPMLAAEMPLASTVAL